MTVTLVGVGCGTEATLTQEARRALLAADYLIGARRLLDELSGEYTANRAAATKPQAIWELLAASGAERPCVAYSGDSGFYSGARSLLPILRAHGAAANVLPGVSSVQALAARLGRPWQDWKLVSAHGVECDVLAAVSLGRPAFFLTGGALGPSALCGRLAEAGLGALPVTIGENLTYPDERILTGRAADFAGRECAPLSVLLAEPAPRAPQRAPGWPDDAFERGDKIPMTKQEVRAAILSKLAVSPEDVCWDVGAGTGSVSVEMALMAREVWAVECKPEACGLIRANRARFFTHNLHVVEGLAPEALASLPRPDAVFVGGSNGSLPAILRVVHAANPEARVCASAIALETLSAAVDAMTALGYDVEVTQVSVSRTRAVGTLHLLMAQNPVFLITGTSR